MNQIKKEKQKKKMMQMISEKPSADRNNNDQQEVLSPEDEKKPSTTATAAGGLPPMNPKKQLQNQHQSQSLSAIKNDSTSTDANKPPAGSGLAVVRRARSATPTGGEGNNKQNEGVNSPEEGKQLALPQQTPEEIKQTLEQLEAKRLFSLQQSTKIASYLNALTEQKKKEEMAKKKKEERQKKRMVLLSQRLLKEAQEMKLIVLEDKKLYQELYSKHHSKEMEEIENKVKKQSGAAASSGSQQQQQGNKKITPEMAELIAQRLAKKSNVVVPSSSDNEQQPSQSTKSVKPPKPALKRPVTVNEDDDNDDGDDSGDEKNNTSNRPTPVPNPPTVPYRDFNDWKRKNGCPNDGKVFCMTGWYPCVKQALLDRGWYFNADPASPFCHLKWTLRSIDVNQDTLQSWQLTNHYLKNVAITTKAGLIKSLKSVIWMADVDVNDIIPRAYDLTVQDDMITFLEDYRHLKAEAILKKLYHQATGLEAPIHEDPNEYRPLSSHNPGAMSAEALSPLKDSPQNDEDDEEEGEEKKEKKHHIPVTVTNDDEDKSTPNKESEPVVDLNEFALPSVPPCPALPTGAKLQEIKINSVIFEIACQLLENQLKAYNNENTGSDNNNNNNNDLEEINVYDYDYCPSGYHEINTSSHGTTTASYSTGINPAGSNYPKSVISGIKLVSDIHWEIIDNFSVYNTVASGLPFDSPEPLDGFIRNATAPSGSNTPSGGGNNTNDDEYDEVTGKKYTYQQLQREKRRLMKIYEEVRENLSSQLSKPVRSLTVQDLQRIHRILSQRVLYIYGKYQSNLNGKNSQSENLWIVKPAAKSRGRGIMTFALINKLLKYIDAGTGLSTQWIVQKYMENPLIIAKRKFDLRQWVLVTSWNPLTIYFYNECYARFSVDEYSTDIASLDNLYAHLVNNSIGKNSENFHKIIVSENNVNIDGYMWSFADFGNYLKWATKQSGKEEDILLHKIQPRMKEIAIYTLMCASEMIEHRKNSWELYGFDFMVDDNYNTWLIEVNSSPACDYSTKVTERYVQKALVELLSVVLDVREWEAQPKKSRGAKPSTGGWENIFQGPLLELPLGSFGTEISLKGEAVKSMNRRPNQTSSFIPQSTLSFMNNTANETDNNNNTNPLAVTSLSGKENTSKKMMINKTVVPRAPSSSLPNKSAGRRNNYNEKTGTAMRVDSIDSDDGGFNDDDDDEGNEGGEIKKSNKSMQKQQQQQQQSNEENNNNNNNYDDSDEENNNNSSSKKSGQTKKGNKPAAVAGNKKEKTPVVMPTAAPSTSVAIPIKTFTMDF
jgi:hypothetical protein